jgi:hypothetical protein
VKCFIMYALPQEGGVKIVRKGPLFQAVPKGLLTSTWQVGVARSPPKSPDRNNGAI